MCSPTSRPPPLPPLQDKKPYSGQLEPMLLQHVVPLFESPHGHLRAKACWLAGHYADIQFQDGQGRGPTFAALLQRVVAAIGGGCRPAGTDWPAARLPCRMPLLPLLQLPLAERTLQHTFLP